MSDGDLTAIVAAANVAAAGEVGRAVAEARELLAAGRMDREGAAIVRRLAAVLVAALDGRSELAALGGADLEPERRAEA